ncbi:MAG: DUF1116 domain-containing protein [Acidimicrobiia bacterium]|nr:DUF1116 domain-containing protein [Acidimicrobiia bacterium]
MQGSVGNAIDEANREVVRRLTEPDVTWRGVRAALDVIPGMKPNLVLHSGPPVGWAAMAAVQQQAVIGAALFEGLADDEESARSAIERGEIEIAPCHDLGAVGAMAGATSASMAVIVVENDEFGNRAFCKVVERALQFGQFDDGVFENLRWLVDVLGPALHTAVEHLGGVRLVPLISRALHMGDECHNRNVAATALLLRTLAPALAEVAEGKDLPGIFRYFEEIDQAFLGFAMATAKALTDAANGVAGSSVVTTMARNGVEFGIKVSGLGDRWLTGPAQVIEGAFMPGHGPEDATPDQGDSAIVETVGLGAMAMANALTAGAISGGTARDAIARTRDNMQIAAGRSRSFTVPVLDFEGTPVGIDVRAVVRTGILPTILTGIAGCRPPWGRIGAGVVRPPMEPFVAALRGLDEALRDHDGG